MTSTRSKAIERRVSQWPQNRRRNFILYTFAFGTAGFGGTMFLFMSTMLYIDGRATLMLVLALLALCLVGGAIWGLSMFLFLELRYRRWRRGNAA
jgi:hypothetical protein